MMGGSLLNLRRAEVFLSGPARDGADFPIRIQRFPPYPAGGVNGGHVGAYCRCGGVVVLVSIHGYDNGGRARQMARPLCETGS